MTAEFLFGHQLFVNFVLLGGEVFATFAVAYGIVLETPENPNERQRRAVRFVIAGVIFEAIFSVGLFAFDESVMSAQGNDIHNLASLTDKAGKVAATAKFDAKTAKSDADTAIADAGTAKETAKIAAQSADDAEKRLKTINRSLAAAEKELRSIRARMGDRHLTKDQQRKISEVMAPFAGTRFWVIPQRSPSDVDSEQWQFTQELRDALAMPPARWKMINAIYRNPAVRAPDFDPINDRGCVVAGPVVLGPLPGQPIGPDQADNRPKVLALVKVLSEFDIDCKVGGRAELRADSIEIDIGLR